MEQYYTKDGLIELNNGTINFKSIPTDNNTYRYQAFLLILLFTLYQVYLIVNDRPDKILSLVIGLIWITPHLFWIYSRIFIESWRRKYNATDIKEIVVVENENILEQKIIVRLKPARSKFYIFRINENQMENFINQLITLHPGIIVSR